MTNRQAAINVIKLLRQNGYQALLAGGCVRDMLLGKRPKDYDVATDAHPGQVIKIFRRTLKIGAKFGVIIVMDFGSQVEVATFRTEFGYADGRHPDKVKFSTASEDAERRDFTINGMFYDPIGKKVVDYVKGQVDLKKKIIRTIGNPKQRFDEDYLRMLRAIRFSTRLGFKIAPATFSVISNSAGKITKISAERIASELEKILTDPARKDGAKLLIKSRLAKAIFPGFTGSKTDIAVAVLAQLRKQVDFPLALTAFFAGFDTDIAIAQCQKLKLSRNQNKHIKFLLTHRDVLLNADMPISSLKLLLAQPYFWDMYELQRAIQRASKKTISPLVKITKRAKALKGVQLKPKPILNGHDLIKLGASPGPALGLLAQEMYIAQLETKIKTKVSAKVWTKNWLKTHPEK